MIRIIEVGPRDGLQNEPVFVPTSAKIAFVNALSQTGATEIEASAFVSPKWVPQVADAADVFAGIERTPGVTYSALVPNELGLDRAVQAKADKIAIFTAASETFNQKNINTTIEGSFARLAPVVKEAESIGLRYRGYVSTAFWCPFEGKIDPQKAADVIERVADTGVTDVSIGDTIGRATEDEVRALLELVFKRVDPSRVAMHFHDTFGQATNNVVAAWKMGVEIYDACTGGIGGCPYAPGAPGNVATSGVVEALRVAGARVDIDLEAVRVAKEKIIGYLGAQRQMMESANDTKE